MLLSKHPKKRMCNLHQPIQHKHNPYKINILSSPKVNKKIKIKSIDNSIYCMFQKNR